MTALIAQISVRLILPFTAPGDTEEERSQLAHYAEKKLAPFVGDALGKHGQVVDVLVEEVRDADDVRHAADGPPAAPPVASAQEAAVAAAATFTPPPDQKDSKDIGAQEARA